MFGEGRAKYRNKNGYIGYFKNTKRHGKGEMVYVVPENEEFTQDLGKYTGIGRFTHF